MDLFKKNVLLLKRFAMKHALTFHSETSQSWPHVIYKGKNGTQVKLTIRHLGRVASYFSEGFESKDVEMFECFVDPTQEECILFEIEKGRRYLLDYRRTFNDIGY